MEQRPEAWRDIIALGVTSVPVVTYGDQFVHGWNPRGVAELLGHTYEEPERLTIPQLQERQRLLLTAAQRALRQVPTDKLVVKAPVRDRTLRQLGYHIFRLSYAFIEAMDGDGLTYEALVEEAPPSIQTGEDIARYGEWVSQRLAAWYAAARPERYEGEVTTYYGPQSVFDLLERTVWHAAQHVRQVYLFSEWIDVQFDEPLTDAAYRGLPMPESLW